MPRIIQAKEWRHSVAIGLRSILFVFTCVNNKVYGKQGVRSKKQRIKIARLSQNCCKFEFAQTLRTWKLIERTAWTRAIRQEQSSGIFQVFQVRTFIREHHQGSRTQMNGSAEASHEETPIFVNVLSEHWSSGAWWERWFVFLVGRRTSVTS